MQGKFAIGEIQEAVWVLSAVSYSGRGLWLLQQLYLLPGARDGEVHEVSDVQEGNDG